MSSRSGRLVLALLVLGAPLSAQDTRDSLLVAGARVRLTFAAREDRRVVTISHVSADSLFVRLDGDTSAPAVAVARSSIARVEVSRGTAPLPLAGMAIGMSGGAVIGGVLASAAWKPCQSTEPFGCLFHFDRGAATALGAIGGGLLGAVVGVLVGTGLSSERWGEVRSGALGAAVAPLRHARLGLGASVAF